MTAFTMSPHPDFEEIILEDVSTHIYELQSTSSAQDLGIQQRSASLSVTIDDTDYNFSQSLSSLNKKGSTTGFVLWRVSVPFVEWLRGCGLYDLKGKYIVEVGAGVTGLFSCVLGPQCSRYIATDQHHLLKLLKSNISDNVKDVDSSTIDGIVKQKKKRENTIASIIDVLEFDWEDPERGMYNVRDLTGSDDKPDFIVGCDIVYNDFLVPHLANAFDLLCGDDTVILIGLQVRLPENIELFVETMLEKGFKVYRHTEHMLSEVLQQGFVVYNIQRSTE